MNITNLLYVAIMSIVFCFGTCAQEVINTGNFDNKIAKDIVAVEFWAGWNKANEFAELNKLKDTSVLEADKKTIQKSIDTLILNKFQ